MNIQTWISDNNGTETLGWTYVQLTADEVALLPKSLQKAFIPCAGGMLTLRSALNFYSNTVTGERNETAIRKLSGMISKIEKAGHEITTDQRIVNGASLADIKRVLSI